MIKKVGILTFHDAANYGAFLQAYALQEYLKKISDNQIEVVNYKAEFIKKSYSLFSKSSGGNLLKSILKNTLYFNKNIRRNKTFSYYVNKYLSLSKSTPVSKSELLLELTHYDVIISGSDQIWNLDLTNNDVSYFLPYPKNKKYVKASYAGSFGNLSIKNNEEIVSYLREMDFISCREQFSKNELTNLYQLEAENHVDPTLLLNEKEWNKIGNKERIVEEEYILLYTVKQPSNLYEKAVLIAKEKGLKIVQIKDKGYNKDVHYLSNQSPGEYVSLFRDATYILTNSFHGTVFSIINKKNFLVELKAKDLSINTRSESLLNLLGLSERTLENGIEYLDSSIEWNNVDKLLLDQQRKSSEYLIKVMNQ